MAGTITAQPGGTPIDVDFLSGVLLPNTARQDFWQQAGVAGWGAHLLADGDSRFLFRLVKFTADAADREAWKADLYALKRSLVTIVDDEGVTHEDLLINDFSQPVQSTIFKDGAAVKSCRCEMILTGIKT